MSECLKFKKIISKYIDQETKKEETVLIKSHLENCLSCREFFEDMSKVKNLVVTMPKKVLPENYIVENIEAEIFNEKFGKENFSFLENIAVLAKKFMPVPVSVIVITVFFLMFSSVKPVNNKVNIEDTIISGSPVNIDTVLSLILEKSI